MTSFRILYIVENLTPFHKKTPKPTSNSTNRCGRHISVLQSNGWRSHLSVTHRQVSDRNTRFPVGEKDRETGKNSIIVQLYRVAQKISHY